MQNWERLASQPPPEKAATSEPNQAHRTILEDRCVNERGGKPLDRAAALALLEDTLERIWPVMVASGNA